MVACCEGADCGGEAWWEDQEVVIDLETELCWEAEERRGRLGSPIVD